MTALKTTDIANSLCTCTVSNTVCKCVIMGFLFLGNLGLSIILIKMNDLNSQITETGNRGWVQSKADIAYTETFFFATGI